MVMSPEEFYAHAIAAADEEGRLPLSRMTGWEVFPFDQSVVWSDRHWRLKQLGEESGVPLLLVLESIAHHDLADLPDDRAAELGLLTVRIVRAIEALPHIARAHVSRWGDGGAHLHVFFLARPAGFPQLRGTCLAIWDDLLPAVPVSHRDRDAAAVANALAGHGGQAAAMVTSG
jgi:diadenosine tetraphosphate (Ap4A) HIT family hydrolase